MELSETQEALIQLLKESGANREQIIVICLMLHKSEDATEKLLLYIYDNKPTNTQIMEKAMELHDNLPKELQVAENYSED